MLSVDEVEITSPKTGGLGIKEAISARGMEAEVPLLAPYCDWVSVMYLSYSYLDV